MKKSKENYDGKRTVAVIDFTDDPGADLRLRSKNSGQEFYEDYLKPAFEDCDTLTVYLDGTRGYASSFLRQCFGSLVTDFGYDRVKSSVTIVSNEEPHWISYIENEVYPKFRDDDRRDDCDDCDEEQSLGTSMNHRFDDLYNNVYCCILSFQRKYAKLRDEFELRSRLESLYGTDITSVPNVYLRGVSSISITPDLVSFYTHDRDRSVTFPTYLLDYNDEEMERHVMEYVGDVLEGEKRDARDAADTEADRYKRICRKYQNWTSMVSNKDAESADEDADVDESVLKKTRTFL